MAAAALAAVMVVLGGGGGSGGGGGGNGCVNVRWTHLKTHVYWSKPNLSS